MITPWVKLLELILLIIIQLIKLSFAFPVTLIAILSFLIGYSYTTNNNFFNELISETFELISLWLDLFYNLFLFIRQIVIVSTQFLKTILRIFNHLIRVTTYKFQKQPIITLALFVGLLIIFDLAYKISQLEIQPFEFPDFPTPTLSPTPVKTPTPPINSTHLIKNTSNVNH